MRFFMIALLIPVSAVFFYSSQILSAELQPGDMAPGFRVFAGNEIVDLNSFRGVKPVVLSFFATTCLPCKKEIPYLLKMSKNGSLFKLILVATDTGDATQIQNFFKSFKVSHPYIYDPNGRITQSYNNPRILPHTVFIGKSGAIVSIEVGYSVEKEKKMKDIIISLEDK